ncbi:hypothetical protein K438DRAFT_1429239, partial [Mycena galopus ATCC 62051]
LYINKTIPSSHYNQNKIKSSYITSITLTLDIHTIHLFSVYNPPDSDDSVINTLKLFLSTLYPLPLNHSFIILGDYNKHHVIWTG